MQPYGFELFLRASSFVTKGESPKVIRVLCKEDAQQWNPEGISNDALNM